VINSKRKKFRTRKKFRRRKNKNLEEKKRKDIENS
jgi:hypothetical protein